MLLLRRWFQLNACAFEPSLYAVNMPIDLMEYLRTGEFGPMKLGDHLEKLLAELGEPEATGGFSRKQTKPSVLSYGDIEFGIDRNGDAPKISYISINRAYAWSDKRVRFVANHSLKDHGFTIEMPLASYIERLNGANVNYRLGKVLSEQVIVTEGGVCSYPYEGLSPRSQMVSKWITPEMWVVFD